MYKLFILISVVIRTFYLPNPFINFPYGMLINIFIEPLLHIFTFSVVGLFYKRGELPFLGSFLYLFFYIVHIGLLQLWNYMGTSILSGLILVIGYISIMIFIKFKVSDTRAHF